MLSTIQNGLYGLQSLADYEPVTVPVRGMVPALPPANNYTYPPNVVSPQVVGPQGQLPGQPTPPPASSGSVIQDMRLYAQLAIAAGDPCGAIGAGCSLQNPSACLNLVWCRFSQSLKQIVSMVGVNLLGGIILIAGLYLVFRPQVNAAVKTGAKAALA